MNTLEERKMVTHQKLTYLIAGLIIGFIFGAIIVTAIYIFSEKSKDE